MDASNIRIESALELVNLLDDVLPVGTELREQAILLCRSGKLAEAAECCRKLYHLGLNEGSAYVQGVSCHLLGSIYLALDVPTTDLDKAAEYFERSAQLFNTYSGKRRQRNEGVVWLSMGRLYEEQCRRNKNRWDDAINAYKNAATLFDQVLDPLGPEAFNALHIVTQKMSDWLTVKKHAEVLATVPAQLARTEGPYSRQPITPISLPHTWTIEPDDTKMEAWAPTGFFLFILMTMLIIIVLPIVIVFLADSLLTSFVPNVDSFLFGYMFAALSISMFGIIGVLISYVRYNIPANQAVIVEYRGRTWEWAIPGKYWLVPFVEQIRAFISLQRSTTRVFVREFSTSDGFAIAIRAMVEYVVKDGVVVWRCIRSGISSTRALGFSRPVGIERTTASIENLVQQLVRNALLEAANDSAQQNLFRDKTRIQSFILNRLTQESQNSGIQFNRIEIDALVREG